MAGTPDLQNSKVIVEWGAGEGHVTREILKKMGPHQSLIAFEVLEIFAKKLAAIRDHRLVVIRDDFMNTERALKRFGYIGADCILSSIPITALTKDERRSSFEFARACLKKDGSFVQYAYIWWWHKPAIERVFPRVRTRFVLANLPPAFVYHCRV
jgi:phospholipid N-methyltransferase